MSSQLPDLLALLSPLFAQCAPNEQRILLAMLERLAAEHYRRWADEVSDSSQKQGLLAAAAREEHIAEVAENLDPHAAQIAKTLWERFPNLRSLYADAMRPMTRIEQWKVQSAGEHGGSQLWRSFAEAEPNPAVRAKLLACSEEDEENSRFLADTLKAMGVH